MKKLMGQLTLALLAFVALVASGMRPALAAPPCATLASDPVNGISGAPEIKTASSAVVAASGPNAG